MTVGTSLLTNKDLNMPDANRRPWTHGARPEVAQVLIWMSKADQEIISTETNTLLRLDVQSDDEILLLHSDTDEGKYCAEVLAEYFKRLGPEAARLWQAVV